MTPDRLYRINDSVIGRLGYELIYISGFCGLTLGFSFRTTGRNHIPKSGPALIIANHESFFDPLIVGLATRRPLYFLARKTLFRKRWLGKFLRFFQSVPVDHHGMAKEGIKAILEVLAAGEAVVLFPEGTRSADGRLHELQPGIQLLLKRSRAPVVPVGIAGSFAAWPRWRSCPVPSPLFLPASPRTIAVAVCEPLDSGPLLEMERDTLLKRLHDELTRAKAVAERLRRK